MALATCDSAASMVPFLETFPLVTTVLIPVETSISTGGDLSTISTTTIETMTAWAPMIRINWRSADLAATPASTPSDATSTSARPRTAANGKPSGTVTVGSIIGITVGCPMALLAACAVWFLLRRRTRTEPQAGTKEWKEHHRTSQPLQQDDEPSALVELEPPRKPIGMAGTGCVSELEGTSSEGGIVVQQ